MEKCSGMVLHTSHRLSEDPCRMCRGIGQVRVSQRLEIGRLTRAGEVYWSLVSTGKMVVGRWLKMEPRGTLCFKGVQTGLLRSQGGV